MTAYENITAKLRYAKVMTLTVTQMQLFTAVHVKSKKWEPATKNQSPTTYDKAYSYAS